MNRRLIAAIALGGSVSLSSFATAAESVNSAAAEPSFASRADAEAFLARAIPAATAANPKYREPGADLQSRWLTKTVSFLDNEKGGVVVSTEESIEDFHGDAPAGTRTHAATFALDDVAISEEIADDLTETGERARGVMFRCIGAPCIEAVWSGAKYTSPWTDIYVQDEAQRRRIFNAFKALQKKPASP